MLTEIIYKGAVIGTVAPGESKVLKCNGKKMTDDVTIKAGERTEIRVDGAVIAVAKAGETKTIKCAGKTLKSNIEIRVEDGKGGTDGFSPTVELIDISGGTRITITDINGPKSVDIMDGVNGKDGKKGDDGFSPTVTASKSGKVTTITITDKSGTKTATINDGADGKTPVKADIINAIKGSLTLGIASDGLIYLFVDGAPVGTGIPQGQSGDVFGYVDENNTIVLNGNLADGTYTLKYEMSNGDIVDIGNMVLDSTVYHSVTSHLSYCSISNASKTVADGESYSATITANSGYNISSITVTMGGTDITSSAVNGSAISIASVTGDIVVTAVAAINTYTVTKNLTNCSISNTTSAVSYGASYNATITPDGGYELASVVVTMGGEAVTVTNGVINIASVTGNIVITAVAESSGPTNLADPTSADWQEGYRLSLSSGTASACTGHTVTNYIPAKSGDVLRVKGLSIVGDKVNDQYPKICAYNSSKSNLGGLYGSSISSEDNYGTKVSVDGDISTYTLMLNNSGTQKASTSTAYIRIDGVLMDGYTKNDVVITVNEEIASAPTAEPVTVDIALTDAIRIGSDGGDRTQAGYCATEMIDLRSIPKPCTINLTKAQWCSDGTSSSVRYYVANASGTALDSGITPIGVTDYFTVVANNGSWADVTVTVASHDVGYIRFSGYWANVNYSDNSSSLAAANTKATLTYTPN